MIHVQNLHKSYGPKDILQDVSFTVHDGKKVGLVGPNGGGKTTIFKLLIGELEDDGGSISMRGEVLGYLPQKIESEERVNIQKFMEEGLKEDWQNFRIDEKLSEVGLEHLDKSTLVAKLSGGQKTRLALARLLLIEPTCLLLDEPTNNLDLPGLDWIERFVRDFKGSVLVISHDRMFLDRTVEKILELDPYKHTINEYVGGYSDFIEERAKRIEIEIANFERQERKRKKMEEWILLKKQQLKYYQSSKVARQMHAMETRYKREFEGDSKLDKPFTYKTIKIKKFDSDAHDKKVMFKIRNMQFKKVVGAKDITIYARDRVHLQGENGAGKSTFIKVLLGEISEYEGTVTQGPNTKMGYFSQEHEILNHESTVIAEFMKQTKMGLEQDARNYLGNFLFFGDHVFKPINTLSQGEKVKLIMAILTFEPSTFLVFDEPTNHLDLESREVLENALIEHKGGFLIVSHDRYFIQKIGISRMLRVEDGEAKEVYN